MVGGFHLAFFFSFLVVVVKGNEEEISLLRFREAPAFSNGKECKCKEGVDAGHGLGLCDDVSIHVAMTLEGGYMRGTMAAVLSILQHTECPENTVFHFIASKGEQRVAKLEEKVREGFPYLRFQVYSFDEDLVKDRIAPSVRPALEHPLNYARTYVPEILPGCVRRVIYLDSDVLVTGDIRELWETDLHGHALAAPEYCHVSLAVYFTGTFWSDAALSSVFDGRHPCYFNTGVMVMDLEAWRRQAFPRLIEMWMELQKERHIYDLGSLPPFLLVFGGDIEPVAHQWNQHGLGGDNWEGHCRSLHPGPVSLLHWSGKGKPWKRLDDGLPCPLDTLWAPYDLFIH